ncbi:hypothetical protein C8R45DRAFT_1036150 [Mycena sanguinolenta]|nr:hypothetical protein C8R45DRAFT_1036150 [Mycena sanguinolenta]
MAWSFWFHLTSLEHHSGLPAAPAWIQVPNPIHTYFPSFCPHYCFLNLESHNGPNPRHPLVDRAWKRPGDDFFLAASQQKRQHNSCKYCIVIARASSLAARLLRALSCRAPCSTKLCAHRHLRRFFFFSAFAVFSLITKGLPSCRRGVFRRTHLSEPVKSARKPPSTGPPHTQTGSS